MTFQQLNDRLRQELLRRIERGTLSGKLISHRTGYGPPHISNFLRNKRNLSLEALDRLLALLHIGIEDLLPPSKQKQESRHDSHQLDKFHQDKEFPLAPPRPITSSTESVPLVSHQTAFEEPVFRSEQILDHYPVPAQLLANLHSYCRPSRRSWQRFVAIRLRAAQTDGMAPLLQPGGMVVLDRHYTSLKNHNPARPNIYAVHSAHRLLIGQLCLAEGQLLLRPYQSDHPLQRIIGMNGNFLATILGRVVLAINPI